MCSGRSITLSWKLTTTASRWKKISGTSKQMPSAAQSIAIWEHSQFYSYQTTLASHAGETLPGVQFVCAQCQRYAEETDRSATLLLLLSAGGTAGWHCRLGSGIDGAVLECSARTTAGSC